MLIHEIVVLPPLCNPHHYNPPQLSLSGHPTALLLTEPNAPVCSPALRNPRARATYLHSYIWKFRWLQTNNQPGRSISAIPLVPTTTLVSIASGSQHASAA